MNMHQYDLLIKQTLNPDVCALTNCIEDPDNLSSSSRGTRFARKMKIIQPRMVINGINAIRVVRN